jgi:hypothetical protein
VIENPKAAGTPDHKRPEAYAQPGWVWTKKRKSAHFAGMRKQNGRADRQQ